MRMDITGMYTIVLFFFIYVNIWEWGILVNLVILINMHIYQYNTDLVTRTPGKNFCPPQAII